MQIVIDIDDMAYKFVQDTSFVEDESTMFEQTNADRKKTLLLFDILNAIKNGTPLPKRRGRLIILSEDVVKREQMSLDFSCQNWISEVGLSNATVAIIEADKTESESKE